MLNNTQTLCPYTLRPLIEEACNEEHVLPDALGAPSNFTVPAHVKANAEMNVEIDAPAINDDLMKLIANINEVRSRSGDVTATLNGTEKESGLPVVVTLRGNNIDLKYKKPVQEDGDKVTIRCFSGEGEKIMRAMIKAREAKGYAIRSFQCHEGSLQPTIQAGLSGSLHPINRELLKIAYLSCVKEFGDQAIRSNFGAMLRQAMMIKAERDLNAQLHCNAKEFSFTALLNAPLLSFALTPNSTNEHTITCAIVGGSTLVVAVSLFNTFNLSLFAKADDVAVPEDEFSVGNAYRLDAANQTITIVPSTELFIGKSQVFKAPVQAKTM